MQPGAKVCDNNPGKTAVIWSKTCELCRKYKLQLSDTAGLVYREALIRPRGDLCVSSPTSSISPLLFLPLPLCTPPSSSCSQHPYLLHHVTSHLPSHCLERKRACILPLYPNKGMWDITGCDTYPGFNTQSAEHNTSSGHRKRG